VMYYFNVKKIKLMTPNMTTRAIATK